MFSRLVTAVMLQWRYLHITKADEGNTHNNPSILEDENILLLLPLFYNKVTTKVFMDTDQEIIIEAY